MSPAPRDQPDDNPDEPSSPEEEARERSELEDGVEHLGRAFGGLMSKLLGEKVTGIQVEPDKPVLSPQADAAVEEIGELAGRWLSAAGRGLKQHPGSPGRAMESMLEKRHEEVETTEGVAPLTAGLKDLAGGLYKSTEAVLDKVAPRKPKADEAHGDDAEGGETQGSSQTAEDPASS